jgi:hypothetical protein
LALNLATARSPPERVGWRSRSRGIALPHGRSRRMQSGFARPRYPSGHLAGGADRGRAAVPLAAPSGAVGEGRGAGRCWLGGARHVAPFELSARGAARRRPAWRPCPGVPGSKSERARHSPVVARVAVPGRPRAGSLRGLGGRHRCRAARGWPDRGASRAPTSLKRRCVEPQQRAGGRLSRPRVPLAGSCRPPTGFDQFRGRRAVAETCQPTAPPLVLA